MIYSSSLAETIMKLRPLYEHFMGRILRWGWPFINNSPNTGFCGLYGFFSEDMGPKCQYGLLWIKDTFLGLTVILSKPPLSDASTL